MYVNTYMHGCIHRIVPAAAASACTYVCIQIHRYTYMLVQYAAHSYGCGCAWYHVNRQKLHAND